MNKIFSGRWILTVACAIVFAYASIKGILDAATVATVLMFVFKSYFDRGDRHDGGSNGSK